MLKSEQKQHRLHDLIQVLLHDGGAILVAKKNQRWGPSICWSSSLSMELLHLKSLTAAACCLIFIAAIKASWEIDFMGSQLLTFSPADNRVDRAYHHLRGDLLFYPVIETSLHFFFQVATGIMIMIRIWNLILSNLFIMHNQLAKWGIWKCIVVLLFQNNVITPSLPILR